MWPNSCKIRVRSFFNTNLYKTIFNKTKFWYNAKKEKRRWNITNNKIIASNNDIVFFKKDNGDTNIELLINGETLWVTQKTMAEIFDVQRPAW